MWWYDVLYGSCQKAMVAAAWTFNSSISTSVVFQTFVLDLAGNQSLGFNTSFTTAAGAADTTPPQVVSVTPVNGATGIGLNGQVVLTFSEPLLSNTVNASTFGLFANGVSLNPGVSISADNQTVVLSPGTLPAGSVITVVATRDVTDL